MRYTAERCRLGDLLLLIGKTQKECARGTGVSKASISQYVNDEKVNMSLELAVSLTEWFNNHLDEKITERDLFVWRERSRPS